MAIQLPYADEDVGNRYFDGVPTFDEVSVEDEVATAKQGKPVFKVRHRMTLRKRGVNNWATEFWMDTLEKTRPELYRFVSASYDAWRGGRDLDVEGTPLAVWGGIDAAARDQLANVRVRTVEELAALPDPAIEKMGMGARTWRDRAKKFLEVNGGEAMKNAEAMRAMEDKIARLEAMLDQKDEPKPAKKAKVNEPADDDPGGV